ncbi:winged helix-turn-helix transcriptional regulator [Cohnella sp.]|uniref:winged helix-turn-helix transcriptional regulator n=1 Tax=Cohnella sp. TaxID=1883426 RepID=UPI003563437C
MEQPQMCPRFEKAMELLSKRWIALIVFQLLSGKRRFSEIDNSLPNLSGKVLSERLKELEIEGLIKRDVYPDIPVRIEYSLTEKGLALSPLFTDIAKWATEWIPVSEGSTAKN